MATHLSKEDCIFLIQQSADKLGRLPKKSDFDENTVSMIKSFFGPWPRALEAAGVKEINTHRIEKKQQRRIRARENQKRYREEHLKEDTK